jgi:transposase-like protein
MARSTYSDEVKAAVMAALLAGQSLHVIAREHGVPIGTIRSWKSRMHGGHDVASVTEERRQRIGMLLAEYLEESLQTLITQVRFARNEDWLAQQDGSQFAVLYGVGADKALRILEALATDDGDGAMD